MQRRCYKTTQALIKTPHPTKVLMAPTTFFSQPSLIFYRKPLICTQYIPMRFTYDFSKSPKLFCCWVLYVKDMFKERSVFTQPQRRKPLIALVWVHICKGRGDDLFRQQRLWMFIDQALFENHLNGNGIENQHFIDPCALRARDWWGQRVMRTEI